MTAVALVTTQGTELYAGWPAAFVKLQPRKKKIPAESNRVETRSPQQAEQWLAAGFNVGLVPGKGLVVVDVDPRNGGDATFSALREEYGIPKTLSSRSGGGGWHLFYKWPEGVGKPAGKLGEGIDIKWGENCHVVAPGSTHPDTGSLYAWRNDKPPSVSPIAPAPEWLVDKLTKGRASPKTLYTADIPGQAPDIGTDNLREPETPEGVDRVKNALKSLDANMPYDEWRNVVWACCATGWPSAVEAARAWSQTSESKWNEAVFEQVAGGFQPIPDGITIGTLFHKAQEAGWQDPRAVITAKGAASATGTGDLDNARAFARRERDQLLFVHDVGRWLRFDQTSGWLKANYGDAERAAKALVDEMRVAAAELWKTDPESAITKRVRAHVERSSAARALRDMIELAKSEPGLAVSLNQFDADPMCLGVTNGVLDLRTRRLLPSTPRLLVSKRAAVAFDPTARCPRFCQFIGEVLPDQSVRTFFQRWAGYLLTGSVDAQAFVFLHGSGRNGKSVLVELLAWLLGDYARKIPTEMLMANNRDPNAPAPEIVGLKGMRLVYTSETEDGQRIATARVKELTGGDRLTGRVPYAAQSIAFTPTHKLMMTGNHKPDIRDDSIGMWRRVLLVNFDVTIPEERVDYELADKLRDEGAGILNWCLDGLDDWKREGLNPPQIIKAATERYKTENDTLGEWFEDHLDRGATFTVPKAEVYRAYRSWCVSHGHHPLSANKLGRRLAERGIKNLDRRSYVGVCLTDEGLRVPAFP